MIDLAGESTFKFSPRALAKQSPIFREPQKSSYQRSVPCGQTISKVHQVGCLFVALNWDSHFESLNPFINNIDFKL